MTEIDIPFIYKLFSSRETNEYSEYPDPPRAAVNEIIDYGFMRARAHKSRGNGRPRKQGISQSTRNSRVQTRRTPEEKISLKGSIPR